MYSLTDLQPASLAFLLNSSTSASVTRRRITVERTVDGSGVLVLIDFGLLWQWLFVLSFGGYIYLMIYILAFSLYILTAKNFTGKSYPSLLSTHSDNRNAAFGAT